MSELSVSTSLIFNVDNVRIVGTYDDPWFITKDICHKLGLSNVTESSRTIPEKWRGSVNLNTSSGNQNFNIINESGLYQLIMRSNKPDAVKFREWLCEDVIPSLRKKGKFELEESVQQKLLEQEIKYKQSMVEKEEKLLEQNKELTYLSRLFRKKEKRKFNKGECIYLLQNPCFENRIKIGSTSDMNGRKDDYKVGAPNDYTVEYHRLVPDKPLMKAIEDSVLFIFDKYRCESDTKGTKKREWLNTEELKIDNIKKEIDSLCDYIVSRRKLYETDYTFKGEKETNDSPSTTKICCICKEEKELTEFYDRPDNVDGKEGKCKKCQIKKQLKYRKDKKPVLDPNAERKTCGKCNENLPMSFFARNKSSGDGYVKVCNNCRFPMTEKTEKKCAHCEETKPITEFNNCRTSGDGKFSYCRLCSKLKSQENKKRKEAQNLQPSNADKQCIKCKITKESSAFGNHIQAKDGKRSTCNECCNERKRQLTKEKSLKL